MSHDASLEALRKRANGLFLSVKPIRGYLVTSRGEHKEGSYCKTLDDVRRELDEREKLYGQ